MEDMGALQPELLSPVAIPEGYNIIVIDLQDCFFTIPLNDEDKSDLLLVCHQKILNSLFKVSVESVTSGNEK